MEAVLYLVGFGAFVGVTIAAFVIILGDH